MDKVIQVVLSLIVGLLIVTDTITFKQYGWYMIGVSGLGIAVLAIYGAMNLRGK